MSSQPTKKGRGAPNTDRPNFLKSPDKERLESDTKMIAKTGSGATLDLRPRRSFTIECEIIQLIPANKVAVFSDGKDYWTEPVDMVAAVRRYSSRLLGRRGIERERIGDLIIPARLHDPEWFIEGGGYDTYLGMIDPGADPKKIPAIELDASARLIPSPSLASEVSL